MSEVTTGVVALFILVLMFLTGLEISFGMAVVGFVGFAYLIDFSAACNLLVKDFFDTFKNFRRVYGELQEILFVYLSYILECYSKTALSPMKLEIPRITRTLLYRLIEYGILKPFELIDDLSGFEMRKIAKELGEKDLN